ncbi:MULTISPECIES: DNA polymerase III subunit epsilon [unclassified Streptomyces]|uniref:DNA polymerase III subunit epsilon n=1 Tax=unclassified Streptomyces TaxID=2593676 RepID=UPI0001B53825|nr:MULTISPECIES: DNA polymerase III subunit epsilon [unclassified Streptomyces]MYR29481.1 3'-5' exonuclease [Streptomyces sp. SID4945]SCF46378.1 DNA polymerase III, epsilon subunit [Streptomyces sp. LcepLS]
MSWYEGPLAAYTATPTGPRTAKDRVLSAAVVVQDHADAPPRFERWLVCPGVPVPRSARAALGLSEDHIRRNGRWPAPVMDEVARSLHEHALTGRPLVVLDAPATLALLDRELRRHRATSLTDRLGPKPLRVLDPGLLDTQLDRFRKGSRELESLCSVYRVPGGDPRDPAARALAALNVVRALGRRFAARLGRLNAAELHALQATWSTRGPAAPWFGLQATRTTGTEEGWPLGPALTGAA